ncbi:hypothetical protein C2E23DRAFT_888632 [Lenzites betulinus]|nr:hypothetical protein C2E23DRAFT_888632 [Lenzites betulinus]
MSSIHSIFLRFHHIAVEFMSTSPGLAALLPSLSTTLVFTNTLSTSTCANTTISWNYTGPDQQISLFITNGSSPAPSALSLIAYSLSATVRKFAWSPVNVTSGVHAILAVGQNISFMSPSFNVSSSNTQTCLNSTFLPDTRLPNDTSPSGPQSSQTGTHIGAIIGGTIGGVALFAALVGLCIYFNLRTKVVPGYRWRTFTSMGRRGRPALWSGLSSHVNIGAPSSSPPNPTAVISGDEKERVPLSVLPRLEPNRRRPSTSLVAMLAEGPLAVDPTHPLPAAPPPAFLHNKELPLPPTPQGTSPDRPCKSCIFDAADLASFVWLRRHSSAASPTRRPSGASVVPSSATSQMYRGRDSMWTASPGSPEPRGRASPEVWCGHCGVRRARSVREVVPDVPRLPGGEA